VTETKRAPAKRKRQFGFVVPAASGVAGVVTAASGAAGFAPPPVMRSNLPTGRCGEPVDLQLWIRILACNRAEVPVGQGHGRFTNGAMME
jgi:hypothetical protein